MPYASGYFRTSYNQDIILLDTRTQKFSFAIFCLFLLILPFFAKPLVVDIANQVFLACIGSLALMLLTGFAGLVSLGQAGLLAAGAFTAGVLFREFAAPIWVTLPASACIGAIIGFIFGLPSLRLRGLYLAVSTLGLHFIVVYIGGEYETRRGFSSGITLDPPSFFGWTLSDGRAWYFVLLAFAVGATLFSINLLRSKSGRAWRALRANETVAEALGVHVSRYKLLAFVISSTMTAVAGCLFAYYRSFVSVEAFSLFLSIQYVAMLIIGGLGSITGALLGALFVTLLPYFVEWATAVLPLPSSISSLVFAINQAVFGIVMVIFLIFEPQGLIGIWQRLQNYFLLWPFRQMPLSGGR
jgi:branched-chain amino acid transport system permease protein